MKQSFESYLEEKFINLGEWNERGITKDNCESGFEDWSSQLDVQEVIDLAEKWGKIVFIDGKQEGLRMAKEIFSPVVKENLIKYTDPKPEYSGKMAGELVEDIFKHEHTFCDDSKICATCSEKVN